MNLSDRLRAVVTPRPSAAAESDALGGHPVRPPFEAATRSARLAALDVLGGEWREADGARSFVVARRIAAEEIHGRTTVGTLAERLNRASHAAPLVSVAAARAPFVFFDLETTGLHGGAGTRAFLVGCAWFDPDGAFSVEQHLLLDYASESAMLRAVARTLAAAGALVSFNGKSFDAPLLETRYLFHRMTPPCAPIPHVDVLHPARRFWGGDDDSGCSLGFLEQQVLGARRFGDVPGFEIPARYFQFVRSGDARPLGAVLEHNRLDLLSLAALTSRLLQLIDGGIDADASLTAREMLALGRIYERAGLDARARAALEAAAQSPRHAVRLEALRRLAIGARRARRFEEAAGHWRAILGQHGCPPAAAREAAEALAIHHEHRDRNLSAAKVFALKTLEIENGPAARRRPAGDAVRHRLARIERKLAGEGTALSERRTLFASSPWPTSRPSCGSRTSAPRTSS